MPWYAVEALDDALDATRALLVPFDTGQWLRLALVVFFLGGVWGGPSATAGGSNGGPGAVQPGPFDEPAPPAGGFELPFEFVEVLSVVVAVVAAALVVGLLYVLVGAVMEFVFVESLRRQHVRVRRYANQHFERAVSLFAFRVALGLLVLAAAAVVGFAAISLVSDDPRTSVGLLVVSIPLFVLLAIVVALVDTFTASFVVPVMIQKNVGLLGGWRRFWPTLRANWEQYGVYVVVRFVLTLAAGLLASIVGAVVGTVLIAPLVVVGVVTLPFLGGPGGLLANPVALSVAAVAVLSYLVVQQAAMAVVFVPIQTYFRYHALLVLGDTNPDFDLVPDLRREIRRRE